MAAKKKTATKKKVATGRGRRAKTERPSTGASRAVDRPSRKGRPIGMFRDQLRVDNKDPNYVYRWVLSAADLDKRVYDAISAGWEFVDATKETELVEGSYAVGQVKDIGSVYRVPATRRARDEYLYLMRMHKDLAEEVEDYKNQLVDDKEADILRTRDTSDSSDEERGGQYTPEGVRPSIGFV